MPNSHEKDEYFLRERETLEKMKELKHPHLIQALSAYHRGADKGFVFPYANDGNLAHFWKQHDTRLSPSVVSWALIQMKGLAEGLKKLHGAKMRHGDIKPQNILIFENTKSKSKDLVIADVGIAKYHAFYTHERSDPTKTPFGSRRYEPPEVEVQTLPEVEARKLPRSRKYDLWSLGCVFLEFLIWLDSGAEGFKMFLSTSSVNRHEARFWDGELVRPVIIECMDNLEHKLEQRGQQYTALKDVLNLIRKRLLIRVDERADSAKLFVEIESIQAQFLLNSGGLPNSSPQFLPINGNRADDTVPDAAVLSINVGSTHG
jgi:serine/threonine protein kinase